MYYFIFKILNNFIYTVSFYVRIRHICHQCVRQDPTRTRVRHVDTAPKWCVRAFIGREELPGCGIVY